MISSFMGFLVEEMEPLHNITLNIGERYYIEDTCGCVQNIAVYLGPIAAYEDGRTFSEHKSGKFLFELEKEGSYKYAIVVPKVTHKSNTIVVNLYVEKYSNDWQSASMPEIKKTEYRLEI
jgi:hypothetical protein